MLPRLYRTESEIRKRQINTLKIFNDHVTEIQEGSEYKVTFNAGGNELCLHVMLSKEFPQEKPFLKVSPTVVHPWVNGEGEITSAPGLLNFTVHSDLGRVVQAIIREFERTPPPLASESINNVSPTIPILGIDSDIMGRASPFNYTNRQKISPPTHSLATVQSVVFPELNTLSIDELMFLSECPDSREEFIENLPPLKEINKAVDDLIFNIEELADANLSKQDHLDQLNKERELKMKEVTELAYKNERLNSTYQALSEKYSPKNIKDQLRLVSEASNREGEKVAEAFLNGEIDVEKFINSFIQIRTLGQTRKTKEEKLSQQLHSLEKAGF